MHPVRSAWILTALVVFFPAQAIQGAEGPPVTELRTQRLNGTTYFQVRFATPEAMRLPRLERWHQYPHPNLSPLARLPRLVPQDGKTRCVYPRLVFQERTAAAGTFRVALPQLEFVGKVAGTGPAKFLLLYSTGMKKAAPREDPTPARWLPQYEWAEVPLTLDFDKTKPVAGPTGTGPRNLGRPPEADDLEGRWAAGQAARFAVLETLTPEFGFYAFARAATGRKYRVAAPSLGAPVNLRDRDRLDRRLYENMTGAVAVADQLALRRLLVPGTEDRGERTVDIGGVKGIAGSERSWDKLVGDKKPAPEPLARLVPDDNYYLEFKNLARLLDFADLADQWGTCLTRALQVSSRDHPTRERLERQLCVRIDDLARTFGPFLVRGMAVTGSDGYLREGSDVAFLIHAVNTNLVLLGQAQFIAQARKEHGDRLRQAKEEYHMVTIQSFVTPLREVSLYRVVMDDFVIQCNSLAGVKRIIDTYQGRHESLADAPDFRHMRTVFPMKDKTEDGFLFLSDAFIRRQVSPALKIKEKRRVEALTSLYMANHAALLQAWETGTLPADRAALLAGAGLKIDDLYMPEGKEVAWDVRQHLATSPTYNTLEFATPLLELPIDRVTEGERQAYGQFRQEYVKVWRQYYDPIGFRLSINARRARIETCLLPLAENGFYHDLRQLTGSGTITVDGHTFDPKALVHFVSHLTPLAQDRRAMVGERLPQRLSNRALNLIGRALMVRLDDSPVYLRMADLALRQELDPDAPAVTDEELLRLEAQVPLTAGFEIKRPLLFAGLLTAANALVTETVPDVEWKLPGTPYGGVPIVRVVLPDRLFTGKEGGKPSSHIALYYMTFEGKFFFVSLTPEPLKELIDRRAQQAPAPNKEDGAPVKVNATLRISPAAAGPDTRQMLRFVLELQTQRRALANEPVLYAFYHTGVLGKNASPAIVRRTVMRYLGSLPVSADNSAFVYEPRTDEVINPRHGSLRQPRLHDGVASNSPLGKLLDQLRSVRADLRFEEDGVHTVVTFERRAVAK